MGLVIVYLTGLLLGVGIFALTYYFSKEMEVEKRIANLIVIGVLGVFGGLLIGGFEGMPVSVMGLGIFTIALLLWIGKKSLLWKKTILAAVVIVALGTLAYEGLDKLYGNSFAVGAKDERLDPEIKKYYEQLQVKTDIKGFKTFSTYEDEKAIVLALGKEKTGNNIEVLDVEERSGRSIVKIRTFENKSSEKNPSVIIFFKNLEPNIEIMDTDGTVYKEVQ